MSTPLLSFDRVSKKFKRPQGLRTVQVKALDDVSFTIQPGEFVGLIGHNGAGKSTSIKLLMGFLTADEGSVSVRGKAPNAKGVRRSLGYVPENSSFSDFLTGAEILDAFGSISGLSAPDRKERSRELLAALDIAHAADRLVKTYSKGMTQRLALAQSLLARPEILILDEPMTGLDPIGRRQVLNVLAQELKRGMSLVFCSHLLADVEQLCERLLWLHKGKLHYDGLVRDLLVDRALYELTYRGPSAIAGAEEIAKEVFRMRISPEALRATTEQVEMAGGRVETFEPVSNALENIFLERASGVQA
jgi:ABC-2 type transport system ATP-binding protein